MARIPIAPPKTQKRGISVRLSYAAIDMLAHLKQLSGMSQEAIIERLIVAEAEEIEAERKGRLKTGRKSGPA